jgi:thioesterase domain-containing protein
VQLRLLVRDRFGFDLATARLANAGTGLTLAGAAALIEGCEPGLDQGSSLTRYVSGSKPGAVVLFPGAVGNFFNVEKAAQLVGSGWPVYGLDLQDALWRYPASSMAELANAVRMEIQAAAGAGTPLVFVGYCLGAQFAFEVARQIADSGGGEPLVCAVDTSTLAALQASRRSRFRAAQNALFNLPQWFAWNCAEMDLQRLTQGVLRVMRGIRRTAPEEEIMGIRAATGDEQATLPTAVLERMRANYEAVTSYVPGCYSGPIAVFRTWKRTLFANRDSTMGWDAVSSGAINVQWISGLHHTCMDGRYLAANMAIVNSRIEAFARSET